MLCENKENSGYLKKYLLRDQRSLIRKFENAYLNFLQIHYLNLSTNFYENHQKNLYF